MTEGAKLQAGGTLNPRRHVYIERPEDSRVLELLRAVEQPLEIPAEQIEIVEWREGCVTEACRGAIAGSGAGNQRRGRQNGEQNTVNAGGSSADGCNGNSCNAPGQNNNGCNGNSCNAPGHNKDKKDKKNK